MSLILQIPPLDPSASLRTTLLLRLTGDVMSAITGYRPDMQALPQLLDWMNDLDRGWLAVLRSQAWNPESRTGVDITLDSGNADETTPSHQSTPISQTERTRLRSLLMSGTARMEEWLVELETAGQDYEDVLNGFGLQQGFDDLFTGTLMEMGSFSGTGPGVEATG
jgi:hypothetical protein